MSSLPVFREVRKSVLVVPVSLQRCQQYHSKTMKRIRSDGQTSKEDYERENLSDKMPGIFAKATPNTLSSRRIVSARRVDKKMEFIKHIKALNQTFRDYFKQNLSVDSTSIMTTAAQDYIDFVTQIEDRYLRSYGEVLTFGSGDCGQLAHGVENEDDLMVKFPRVVYSLRDKRICIIACGGLHNAVVSEEGLVYTWGCADDGSLGRPGEETVPLLVEGIAEETVISVSCGDGQTIAVTASREVWGWGCYKDKEGKKWFNPATATTGSGGTPKDINRQQDTPIQIPGISDVVEVVCGSVFNVARCGSGAVYSWGLGECGELGRIVPPLKIGSGADASYDYENIRKHHITPGLMYMAINPNDTNLVAKSTPVSDVKSIGCGAYHTLLLLSGKSYNKDQVLSCGLNNYGQLGQGHMTSKSLLCPAVGLESYNITVVKGGYHHSLVATSDGKLLAFGRGDSGQLGVAGGVQGGVAGGCVATPLEVQLPLPSNTYTVVDVACGANHNLVLLSNNEVYSWGYGDMLALGHGKDRDELTPKRLNFKAAGIDNITIKQVAGGGQHSAIIGNVIIA